jgi:hypothetical protein
MRSLAALLLSLLACAAASAQTPAAPAAPQPPSAREQDRTDRAEGRRNQKVERIHLEDGANVIDETRYGGQTQSITVQPKVGAPEYEIQPTDLGRSRPADHRDGMSNATGQRVWNVFRF